MHEAEIKNPWIGLESYQEGEIIYGRDDDILALIQCITKFSVTLLYGRSGIGKSSILNAGVIPAARRQDFIPIVVRLSHNDGESYTQQLKNAIIRAAANSFEIREVIPVVNADDESVYEFLHRHEFYAPDGSRAKLLILFDQFEEIFTLQGDEKLKRQFFDQMADQLNDVLPEALRPKQTQISDKEIANSGVDTSDLSSIFGKLDLSQIDATPEYVTDNQVHFVFTLRQDYLSEFEFYTSLIPSLSHNRYGLRPINDEQAAQIIMRPKPGMVSKDVAKLIISKVTGRTDFEIDGVPEIEVDSAVLSLYLNRLFQMKTADTITADLVEEKADVIIEKYYAEAIEGLSSKTVAYLENTLINPDGHRDNASRSAMIGSKQITDAEIDDLCNRKKILRSYNSGNQERIEFIHDVLCRVVVAHRRKRNQVRQHRIFIAKTVAFAAVICALAIAAVAWIFSLMESPVTPEQSQNVVVSFYEDDTVNDLNYWQANLTVMGEYKNRPDTLLLNQDISKDDVNSAITINVDTCHTVRFILDFGPFVSSGKYVNFDTVVSATAIMQSPLVKLAVRRDIPKLQLFAGQISLDATADGIPVESAVVMFDNNTTVTDSVGCFQLYLEQLPLADDNFIIAKSGLGCFEIPAAAEDGKYRIFPTDSLAGFFAKAIEMDSVPHWNYATTGAGYCMNKDASQKGISVTFKDGHTDRLKMYWLKDVTRHSRDRIYVNGYFYFTDEYNRLNNSGLDKHLSYFIGSGYINSQSNTTPDENGTPYRAYEFKGYDVAGNLRTVTGRYYVNKSGVRYNGDIIANKRQIATFGHNNPTEHFK